MTESEAQGALEALNIVYRAANAAMPSGLVPEAVKVQTDGINDAAQKVAEFVQKVMAPAVSSNVEAVEVVPPVSNEPKAVKK